MKFSRIALIFLYGIVFLGCDDYREDPYEISDKAPVISIEKIGEKLTETEIEVSFKAVADRAPKTDLLVRLNGLWVVLLYLRLTTRGVLSVSLAYLVIIPKGKTESKVLSESTDLDDYSNVRVLPLHTVTIVGKGEVIDQQRLQEFYGGKSTKDDQKIPEDYIFAYYQVGETSDLRLYHPGKAKIISVDPPNGSTIRNFWGEVRITFDVAPENLKVTGEHVTFTEKSYSPTIFSSTIFIVRTFIYPFDLGKPIPYYFTIEWGKKSEGTDGSQSFKYFRIAP